MQNQDYLNTLSSLGPKVKHILDCPESNIPILARSKAAFFTDRIKMICPLLIPISYGKHDNLEVLYQNESL